MGLPRINGEVGRLWADPTLSFTPSGKAVCAVPLVFKKSKKDANGVWQDVGEMWVRGTVWDQFGENVAESLSKGDEVVVSGELSVREYERQDGSKGSSVELNIWAIGPNLARATAKVNKTNRGGEAAASREPAYAAGSSSDPWGSSQDSPSESTIEAPF